MILDTAALLEQIRSAWDDGSQQSGRLVRKFFGIWHYAVSLSQKSVIFLGPESLRLQGTGYFFIDGQASGYRPVRPESPQLTKQAVLHNLSLSVALFHGKCWYDVRQWNCEHWARLVTSGDAISYQVKTVLQGLGLFTETGCRNEEARRLLSGSDF